LPVAGDLMVVAVPLVALGPKGQQVAASPGHSPQHENMNKYAENENNFGLLNVKFSVSDGGVT